MTEPQYTIAPLAWIEITPGLWRALILLGRSIYIKRNGGAFLLERPHEAEMLEFRTLEAAQLAASQWYRERLRPALREVEVNT